MTAWSDQLRPASWRGVKFSVLSAKASLSRRTAVHEYPFRDDVWVEDLGGGKNTFSLQGWMVGDDALIRRDAMIAAVKTAGAGELVHPTYGAQKVTCVDFATEERWDVGRVVEMSFTFILAGTQLYPSTRPDTKAGTTSAADAVDKACVDEFAADYAGKNVDTASQVGGVPLPTIAGVRASVNEVAAVARGYAGYASSIINDATRILHVAGSFAGVNLDRTGLGRFLRGARSSVSTVSGVARLGSGLGGVGLAVGGFGDLLKANTSKRVTATASCDAVSTAADGL